MLMTDPLIADLWEKARFALKAHLDQRSVDAVFLEGSIAEGFANERSDVDFVAIINDASQLPAMPYILFIDGRRIEVRLLSSAQLRRELAQVRVAQSKGLRAVAALSWSLLDRCQRFMGALPIHNSALIGTLQAELGQQSLGDTVALRFEDFARQTARYAVAMAALDQPDYARAWIKTAVFHAAKSHVARLGEHCVDPKWLALQLERAAAASDTTRRLWAFLHEAHATGAAVEYVKEGIVLVGDLGVRGVCFSPDKVLAGRFRDVTTWQVGERVHVLRGRDVFALGGEAARVWRAITFDTPCVSIAGSRGGVDAVQRRRGLLADFSRCGLIRLRWKRGGEIRARQHATSAPLARAPVSAIDGARLSAKDPSDFQLLPMPAHRFVEAGLQITWANIGLESAGEDALGALQGGQWRVLEYALQRMVQTACMVALGAHGMTPQPPLEEATLEAIRLLGLDDETIALIRSVEQGSIEACEEARNQLEVAEEIVQRLRRLDGGVQFPASFDTGSGWHGTILAAHDWINLGAHLGARFPQTAHAGRGAFLPAVA